MRSAPRVCTLIIVVYYTSKAIVDNRFFALAYLTVICQAIYNNVGAYEATVAIHNIDLGCLG